MLNVQWTGTIFLCVCCIVGYLAETALTEREPTKLCENK